ncbi:hypothetical protein EIN_523740 [Entamoeba invadens IP1]|uniref:EF-hand domain-containing protein n=1 Tax=Entamoeba invadens IP1 TaxID=370355 RepID=A0A0A1UBB9_ENTIV|nr:hypothetical protein EIN_523740 [Entamoeba invadens IP1]ELP92476.1 hypothetical protein EIN_523740 [Entamoeba invadens IP1]|eukprot:XP_004259247.1 hypothetical protein EIN_523740 [Entamoeba invadens IP1]
MEQSTLCKTLYDKLKKDDGSVEVIPLIDGILEEESKINTNQTEEYKKKAKETLKEIACISQGYEDNKIMNKNDAQDFVGYVDAVRTFQSAKTELMTPHFGCFCDPNIMLRNSDLIKFLDGWIGFGEKYTFNKIDKEHKGYITVDQFVHAKTFLWNKEEKKSQIEELRIKTEEKQKEKGGKITLEDFINLSD